MINTTMALTNKLTHVFNSRFSIKFGIESELHHYKMFGKAINYENNEYIKIMDGD